MSRHSLEEISNNGVISAGLVGIGVGFETSSSSGSVTSFTGNILNSGTITAAVGIAVVDSTILGAIVDSGTIHATSYRIEVNSAEVILGGIQVSSKGTIRITSGTQNTRSGIAVSKHHDVRRRHHQQRCNFYERCRYLAFGCYDL